MMKPLVPLLLALLAIPAAMQADHHFQSRPGVTAASGAGIGAWPETGAVAGNAPSADNDAARPLPFFYDLYSFRGDSGHTAVVASFAVRVGDLERERVDGDFRYRFNVTLVVADTARARIHRADDSVYVRVPRRLSRHHLLFTQLETEVRPSTSTVQRVIMIDAPSPGIGQLYTQPYPVRDYSGSQLMLSDIALGLPDANGGWRRGGERLALLPGSHFPGGTFEVYYEIYNMPDGHRYFTDIAIEPVGDEDDASPDEDLSTRVRFHGEASVGPDGLLTELRQVHAPLPEGRHRLTVTVTDEESGRTARRSRLLDVRPWNAGATLVATCPVAAGAVRPGCH